MGTRLRLTTAAQVSASKARKKEEEFAPKNYRPPRPIGVKGGCSPQNNRKNFEATKRASNRWQQILCENFSWVPLHWKRQAGMNDRKSGMINAKRSEMDSIPAFGCVMNSAFVIFQKTRPALPGGDIVTEPGLRKRASQFLILDAQYG